MARNDGIDRTSVRNLAVSDKAVGNTQQHAELIAADTVTVPAAGIGFFDAVCDLGKADISLQMAVAVEIGRASCRERV